ncbi:MAG: cobalt ECF transporter T component CbiQ [Deltaproteobacteria bacterium]|nr:cobalt ECF transporter T component CbiQ [Deltaproteobacteria bacterium]
MASIESSLLNIGYLETLACQETPLHRLDPRAKILTTLAFIITVVSFGKYEITALIPFFIFPVALSAVGNLPPGYLAKKVLLAAPFAFFIGIFNPWLDRTVMVHLGPVAVSGGWVSFASIMLRFLLTVSAGLILIAGTGLNAVCLGLEKLGAPRTFVMQLMFLYRYIFVLTEEALRLIRARSLRSFQGRGLGFTVFSYLIGQLLLRTLARANRIHLAMLSRGFAGKIHLVRPVRIRLNDVAFFVGWSALFILLRIYNLSYVLGNAVEGLLR